MTKFRLIVNARAALWLLLVLPLCYMLYAYAAGALVYGEFVHATGGHAARLLIFTLALTPLRLMFPGRRWPVWLLQRRRYFGLAAFLYSLPHVLAYLLRLPAARIGAEALEPGMAAGWLALAAFLPLAVTSNDASVRRLGRAWQSLHRVVYLAAVLTFLHWVLTAFDPVTGFVHVALLAALESFRIWKAMRAHARP